MNRSTISPVEARQQFRAGLIQPTSGWSAGYAQANLISLPQDLAYDFLLFAQRNPKPCPILEVLDAGETFGGIFGSNATEADIRTDAPQYRIYKHGELIGSPASAVDYWRDDLVSFIIGCSFTFEHPMVQAGVPVRHLEAGRNVPMYETSLACRPAGSLSGNLVVSLRMIPASQVADAVRITSRYPAVHGAPVHIGDPSLIGIDDINNPDFGDAPLSEPGDVPVFWACGVTPQAMVMSSKPPLAITHAPGHMLITDAPDLGFQVP